MSELDIYGGYSPEVVTMVDAIDSILRKFDEPTEETETCVALMTYIIRAAIKSKDMKYIESDRFIKDCELLGLNYQYLREGIKKRTIKNNTWKEIDGKREYIKT